MLAADVEAAQLVDTGDGSARWHGHRTALEPGVSPVRRRADAADAVARARPATQGLTLTKALDRPEVTELLEAYDLLWFAPEELDQTS